MKKTINYNLPCFLLQDHFIYIIIVKYKTNWRRLLMPVSARKRNPDTIDHIMCRSISEIYLFRNDDDEKKYLQLTAQYSQKFQCWILAYCIMDTYIHIQFLKLVRLVYTWNFCSSGRDFASCYLQIPPHGGHPYHWLTVGAINPRNGLSPSRSRACLAN